MISPGSACAGKLPPSIAADGDDLVESGDRSLQQLACLFTRLARGRAARLALVAIGIDARKRHQQSLSLCLQRSAQRVVFTQSSHTSFDRVAKIALQSEWSQRQFNSVAHRIKYARVKVCLCGNELLTNLEQTLNQLVFIICRKYCLCWQQCSAERRRAGSRQKLTPRQQRRAGSRQRAGAGPRRGCRWKEERAAEIREQRQHEAICLSAPERNLGAISLSKPQHQPKPKVPFDLHI